MTEWAERLDGVDVVLAGVAVVLSAVVVIPEAVRMAEVDLNPTVVIVATEVVLSAGVSRLGQQRRGMKWEEGSCNKNHGLSIIERPRS